MTPTTTVRVYKIDWLRNCKMLVVIMAFRAPYRALSLAVGYLFREFNWIIIENAFIVFLSLLIWFWTWNWYLKNINNKSVWEVYVFWSWFYKRDLNISFCGISYLFLYWPLYKLIHVRLLIFTYPLWQALNYIVVALAELQGRSEYNSSYHSSRGNK